MHGSEGLILQGCGGDLTEWVDASTRSSPRKASFWKETKFDEVHAFKHEGLTNLLFPFSEDVKLNIGKLAIWRLASHETFGGTWLTDYVDNRLGGFEMSAFEKEIQRLNTFAGHRKLIRVPMRRNRRLADLPQCGNRAEGKSMACAQRPSRR